MKINIDIPDNKIGDWSIESFEVSEDAAKSETIRSMFSSSVRSIFPGKYKRLMRSGTIVMSNTPVEISDFMKFYYRAKGDVLINGLGLGVLVKALLDNNDVDSITVIEIAKEVIDLVYPTYKYDTRLTVIHDSAFQHKPPKGKQYNAVWHDIWDYITSDNLEEMKTLHRKYGRRCDYQACWCRYQCEQAAKKDRYYY